MLFCYERWWASSCVTPKRYMHFLKCQPRKRSERRKFYVNICDIFSSTFLYYAGTQKKTQLRHHYYLTIYVVRGVQTTLMLDHLNILPNPLYFSFKLILKKKKLYWSNLLHVAQFRMHHTPLTWYKQKNQRYQAYLRFLSSTAYLRLFLTKDGTQRHSCRCYRPHTPSLNLPDQRFLVHLATA
jgi:hypothetical protein